MKAIKCVSPSKAEIQDVAVPQVTEDHILVKVKYAALNPTDWYKLSSLYAHLLP